MQQSLGGLARVGAQELGVRNAVAPGVFLGVFHCLGHDFHPDQSAKLPGHGEADGPGAAIEIQQNFLRSAAGIVRRLAVKGFCLPPIHLIKRQGRKRKFHAAQAVRQPILAPKELALRAQRPVAPVPVFVEQQAGQLWASLAAAGKQVLRLGDCCPSDH